jgi:hypothetical protein
VERSASGSLAFAALNRMFAWRFNGAATVRERFGREADITHGAEGTLYPRNPRLDAEKLARLGKIVARAEAGIPNQEHRVAPY